MGSGASLALEHSLSGDQTAVHEFLAMQQRTRGVEEEDDEEEEDVFREDTELLNDMARENAERMDAAQAHFDSLVRRHTASFYSDSTAREEEVPYDRRTQELMHETQNQLLELMSAAMRATSYKDAAPTNPSMRRVLPTATPDMTHIEQLRTWDQDISSPFLEYTNDSTTCIRRGNAGPASGDDCSLYAAFSPCCPFSYKSSASIILSSAPFRPGLVTFGVALAEALSHLELGFGRASGSWGLVDARDSMGPCSFFSSGTPCGADGCRTLSAGDELHVDIDHTKGEAVFLLNGRRVSVCSSLPVGTSLVVGVTLCEDHAARLVRSKVRDDDDDVDFGVGAAYSGGAATREYLAGTGPLRSYRGPPHSASAPVSAAAADLRMGGSLAAALGQSIRRYDASSSVAPRPAEEAADVMMPWQRPPPPRPSLEAIARSSPYRPAPTATPGPVEGGGAAVGGGASTPPRHAQASVPSSPSASASAQSLECCVCLTNAKSVLFLPCRHLCTCEECGLNAALVLSCPICRGDIVGRMNVFL